MTESEFEKLYNESYRSVYWTAMSFVKNKEEAEDIVQDTFITAYKSYDSLQDKDKFLPWIKKIAANKCLNRITRDKTTIVDDEEFFDNAETVPEDFLPDSIVESDEKRKILMNIIQDSLSEDVRLTLILFYFNGLTTGEISKSMNVPQGTVLSRLNFARKKIKKEVERYEKENNDKLFGMAIPFLTKLFVKEAEQVPLKPMPLALKTLPASKPAVPHGAASKTAIKATAVASKKVTGIMFKKILIGAAALALAGGTTAGVVHVVRNSRTEAPEPEAIETTEVTDDIESIFESSDADQTDVAQTDVTEPAETSDGFDVVAESFPTETDVESSTGIRKERYKLSEDGSWELNEKFNEDGRLIYYCVDGLVTTQEFDSEGHIIAADVYNSDGSLYSHLAYELDANGNGVVVTSTDADGELQTIFEHAYDADGNQIDSMRYRGNDRDLVQEVHNEYADGLLVRSTKIEYSSDDTVWTTVTTNTYDDSGLLLVTCDDTSITNLDGEEVNHKSVTKSYEYDSNGFTLSRTTTRVENGETTETTDEYENDVWGNPTRIGNKRYLTIYW